MSESKYLNHVKVTPSQFEAIHEGLAKSVVTRNCKGFKVNDEIVIECLQYSKTYSDLSLIREIIHIDYGGQDNVIKQGFALLHFTNPTK
jgi:hypothetical protein